MCISGAGSTGSKYSSSTVKTFFPFDFVTVHSATGRRTCMNCVWVQMCVALFVLFFCVPPLLQFLAST